MKTNRGFTLMEVLVAIAVLGIALAAIIRTTSSSAVNFSVMRDTLLAHWVAENRLAEMQALQLFDEGRTQGTSEMAGREWYWVSEITSTQLPNLRQVEIFVAVDEDSDPIASLTGFLADPELRVGAPDALPPPAGEDGTGDGGTGDTGAGGDTGLGGGTGDDGSGGVYDPGLGGEG